jgi:hypothetical protein
VFSKCYKFLKQNNCFQGESTRNFINEKYYVLQHRVNSQFCFQKPSAKNWLILRGFTSVRQKLRPVLKFLFPFYLTLYHGLVPLSQTPTRKY